MLPAAMPSPVAVKPGGFGLDFWPWAVFVAVQGLGKSWDWCPEGWAQCKGEVNVECNRMVRIFLAILWDAILYTFIFPFIYGFFVTTMVRKGVGPLSAAAACSLVGVWQSRPRSCTDRLAGAARPLIASSRLEATERLKHLQDLSGPGPTRVIVISCRCQLGRAAQSSRSRR